MTTPHETPGWRGVDEGHTLASTGPAHEAIRAVGEHTFHNNAVHTATQHLRAGLPRRAEIAVTGYLARTSDE